MKNVQSTWISFILASAILFPPWGSTGHTQGEKLVVAHSGGSATVPLWIAQDKGFFERNKIETSVVYIGGGRIMAQALAADQVKIAVIAGPAVVSANLGGLELRIVAGLVNTSHFTLFVRPSIASVYELKGKKLGLGSFGGSPDFVVRYILREYGLDPDKDVTILQLGAGGDMMRLAALKVGTIDGALIGPPATAFAKKAGLRALVTPETLKIPYQNSAMVSTKGFIDRNPNIVKRAVMALIEAIHFYKTQKEESLEIMARHFKTTDRLALEETYGEFAMKLHPRKPYPTVEGIASILEFQKSRMLPGKILRPEQIINVRFVKELDEAGFIERLYQER